MPQVGNTVIDPAAAGQCRFPYPEGTVKTIWPPLAIHGGLDRYGPPIGKEIVDFEKRVVVAFSYRKLFGDKARVLVTQALNK